MHEHSPCIWWSRAVWETNQQLLAVQNKKKTEVVESHCCYWSFWSAVFSSLRPRRASTTQRWRTWSGSRSRLSSDSNKNTQTTSATRPRGSKASRTRSCPSSKTCLRTARRRYETHGPELDNVVQGHVLVKSYSYTIWLKVRDHYQSYRNLSIIPFRNKCTESSFASRTTSILLGRLSIRFYYTRVYCAIPLKHY